MSDTEKRASEALEALDVLGRVPRLGGVFGTLVNVMDRILATVAGLILVAIAGVVIVQILGRLILPSAPVWTEELSRYLFIMMIAVSAGLVMRRGKHISLELFHHRFGVRGACLYQLLMSVVLVGFAWLIVPYAWQYASIGAFQTSPALKVSMQWVFGATVVLFAMVILYGVIGAIEAVAGLLGLSRDNKATPGTGQR
ncbi:TRAP transporter small permease [Kushneria indalinina]|uniref:TRAP transporter small permease protein n=1 Tax=Kushneria indalinina DSM 14324 TaxID=1122140 RepID=A0A3D9DTS1_9GAMM|nr:TRAP transporter small permease [Kushneria indalinina]REC94163.1 TRAP-type C4-dicarboxylate transport system permease small subunit [Kushneria indalinina DSM 14324]